MGAGWARDIRGRCSSARYRAPRADSTSAGSRRPGPARPAGQELATLHSLVLAHRQLHDAAGDLGAHVHLNGLDRPGDEEVTGVAVPCAAPATRRSGRWPRRAGPPWPPVPSGTSGARNQDAEVLLGGRKIGPGHTLQIGRGHGPDLIDEAVQEAVAANQLEASQECGAPVHRVLLEDELRLDLVLGALQLLVGDQLL